MDETYAEDSFVVGSEVEEPESSEEEAGEDVELMPEDSYVDGKRQYATRRRVFLHRARAGPVMTESRAGVKTKRSRVIRISDSSEEEAEVVSKQPSTTTESGAAEPLWPKTVQQEPVRPQQNQKPSTSSLTTASKVSLLCKNQRRSEIQEKQDER